MNSSFVREGFHVRNFHSESKYLRWVIILGLIMKTHLPTLNTTLPLPPPGDLSGRCGLNENVQDIVFLERSTI